MPAPIQTLTPEQEQLLTSLKRTRDELIQAAEKAAYAYARECEVGKERIRAFEIHENIRNAGRVY
jgi:hypothetical protein